MATMEWVNHASYILHEGPVSLMTDPWLDGPAFDNGWDLLSPTAFPYDRFREISHIWFSHEHPDHFSPPNVKRIPAEVRAGITVLYQKSIDHKVVDFCRKAGFREVIEVEPGRWVRLGEDFEILSEPWDNGDSWIAARTKGGLVLNINDCVITTAGECRRLARRFGPIHTLATQFSYANWVGNKGDEAAMKAAATEKIDWLVTQVKAFSPRYVIPFASFVYFSHEDNFYLNAGMTSVAGAADAIRGRTSGIPVVLYPGDRWDIDSGPPVPDTALERYAADQARVTREGFRHRSSIVPLQTLLTNGAAFLERLRKRNGPPTRLLPAATVYLEDHNQALVMTPGHVRTTPLGPEVCDLVCKSDALNYCFQFDWGGRTLDINGRFQAPPKGHYWRFKAYATLAGFNNRGEGFAEILQTVIRRARNRFLS